MAEREAERTAVRPPRDTGTASTDDNSEPGALSAVAGDGWNELPELLSRLGINLHFYKPAVLRRGVEQRMALNHTGTLAGYLTLLHGQPEEIERLHQELMCFGERRFFGDPEVFGKLEESLIPSLVARAEPDQPLRVWVPVCASGEEAYTLAMLFSEQMAAQNRWLNVQILASDSNDQALQLGRSGRYPVDSAADLTPRRLARHFSRSDEEVDRIEVGKALREMVLFARQNLFADPPFSKLDLIVCRGLLACLRRPAREQLISLFHFALDPDGYLLLGRCDDIDRRSALFEPATERPGLYRRIDTLSPTRLALPLAVADTAPRQRQSGQTGQTGRAERPVVRASARAARWVLDEYAPATVIVNRSFKALYFYGDVGRYLRYSYGESDLNVLSIAGESIAGPLRAGLLQAFENGRPVEVERVRAHDENRYRPCRLRIKPLWDQPDAGDGLAMVSFIDTHDDGPLHAVASGPTDERLEPDTPSRESRLEEELRSIERELQLTLEEMGSSNEELKTANEEMASLNEELQTANEELESSKEELQSLNEELATLNGQLQDKIRDLEQTNTDILNLFNSTAVATLFLDRRFRIKRFTPAATRLFNLIPTDVGRPLTDLSGPFADVDLLSKARRVLSERRPFETEVEGLGGRWFRCQVLPYRTLDDKIDGFVITCDDITELRARARQQSLIAGLGSAALEGLPLQALLDAAVENVAAGLDLEYAKVLELLPDQTALRLQAGVGWREGCVGSALVSSDKASHAGFTLSFGATAKTNSLQVGPVVTVEDLRRERRFRAPALLKDHDVISGLSVVIPGDPRPYGVLGAHSTRRRVYSDEDADFMRGVAHILASAIQRAGVETRLRERVEENQTLMDTLPIGIFIAHDRQAQRITGNRAAEELLQSTDAGNLSKSAPPAEQPNYFRVRRDGRELTAEELPVQRAATGEYVQQEEVTIEFDGGDIRHALVSAAPLFGVGGEPRGAVASILDISARKRAEDALYQEKERAQVTLASIGDAVITTDRDGRVEYLNPIAEALTGWPLSEAYRRSLGEVFRIVDENGESLDDPVSLCLAEDDIIKLDPSAVLISRHGVRHAIEDSAAPINDRDGRTLGVVLVFHDVTEQRRLVREISHQASHDMLTGLVNRREFEKRLQRALENARAERSHHVLFYLDLDQFKIVNDTCGHAAGDELLRQITELFRGNLRRRDTLARLGGDEFGLLLEHCNMGQARRSAEKLRRTLEQFVFVWEGQTFRVSVSIGLVPIDVASGNVGELLQAADSACYVAKNAGRNRMHVYTPEGDSAVDRHYGELRWVNRIQQALAQNLFELYRQLIVPVAAQAGAARGQHCELLLRLVDVDGRTITPEVFLPAAERFQLCEQIDRWVVNTAFRWFAEQPGFLQQLDMCAINLSGHSLSEQTFQDHVLRQLDELCVPAAKICFEITETAAVANLSHAARFIDTLKKRGCQFSLDDFGSGLSSFAYLKNLPVDYLKIDGLFVKDIADDPIDYAMVRSINEIGQLMGKKTVAEHVDSENIMQILQELEVDYAQGFFLNRPEPLRDRPL